MTDFLHNGIACSSLGCAQCIHYRQWRHINGLDGPQPAPEPMKSGGYCGPATVNPERDKCNGCKRPIIQCSCADRLESKFKQPSDAVEMKITEIATACLAWSGTYIDKNLRELVKLVREENP